MELNLIPYFFIVLGSSELPVAGKEAVADGSGNTAGRGPSVGNRQCATQVFQQVTSGCCMLRTGCTVTGFQSSSPVTRSVTVGFLQNQNG